MPKFKSKKAARKRFRLTSTGKVKRFKAGRRHILTKKSRKRKRSLSSTPMVHKTFATAVRKMMGKR